MVPREFIQTFLLQTFQLLDLGAWASESHRIAGDPIIDSDEGQDWVEH